jgi:hypothetical protein
MASDVADGERSLILDQVDSGVAVRMAALALCLRAPGALDEAAEGVGKNAPRGGARRAEGA